MEKNKLIKYGGKAIEKVSNVIKITNKLLALNYNNRGMAYNKLRKDEDAISNYNRAIELDPYYTQAYYNRGIVYEKLGKDEDAISDYSKAIQLDPFYIDAYYHRGIVYNKSIRNFIYAVTDYKKTIQLNPNYTAAINDMKILENRIEEIKEAFGIKAANKKNIAE